MTHRPDFRRALVGLPISLVVLGVFGWVKKDEKKVPRSTDGGKAKRRVEKAPRT